MKWLAKLLRSGKTCRWDLLSSNSISADTVGASAIAVFRLGELWQYWGNLHSLFLHRRCICVRQL